MNTTFKIYSYKAQALDASTQSTTESSWKLPKHTPQAEKLQVTSNKHYIDIFGLANKRGLNN